MAKSIALAAAEWATFLTEHGVTALDAQLAAEHRICQAVVYNESPIFVYTTNALWGAFVWSETPEGHRYWAKVCSVFGGSCEHNN